MFEDLKLKAQIQSPRRGAEAATTGVRVFRDSIRRLRDTNFSPEEFSELGPLAIAARETIAELDLLLTVIERSSDD